MPEPEDELTPSPYDVPPLYGGAAAVESWSSVAAPLLAGGGLAFAGVVLQQQNSFRFPGTVLVLLMAAVLLLVTAVQCGAWARQYVATPQDIAQWWPDANTARMERLYGEQRQGAADHGLWAKRSSLAFNSGIVLLWAALAFAAVPGCADAQPNWRWGAVVVATLGILTEVVWAVVARPGRRGSGRFSRWFYGG